MSFEIRTSIHGRRLGLSTTQGIVQVSSDSTAAADRSAQMWGSGMLETLSTVGAISNYGVTVISSDSTSGTSPWTVGAPVAGVQKEIHFQTPSTLIHLNTSAVTIFFNSSLAEGSTFGSTVLSIAGAAAGIGGSLVLRGLSATVWGVVSNNVGASS